MPVSALVPKKQIRPRQATVLSAYCEQREWDYEVIRDHSSGLNYNKKGLLKLLTLIVSGEVRRLVITHRDRLMRFGAELVFSGSGSAPPPVYARHSILKSSSLTVQWRLAQKKIWFKMFWKLSLFSLPGCMAYAVIKIKYWLTNCVKTAKRILENSVIDTEFSV